jgi:hypothetical protein
MVVVSLWWCLDSLELEYRKMGAYLHESDEYNLNTLI